MMELCGNPVGRTPWSARVPLDPLFVWNQFPAECEWPARGPAADQGARPTIYAGVRKGENLTTLGYAARGPAFSGSKARSARLSRLESRLAARIGRPTRL